MPDKIPKIIVITGAESTGKSVLTKQLADYFHSPYYPEYARDYIRNLGRKYEFGDIEIVARKQAGEYQQAVLADSEFVFFDTWLIITKVWFEVVCQISPAWVSDFIRTSEIAGFIVCNTDLPWEPDGIRENGGSMREILQHLYIQNIRKFGFPFFEIGGLGEARLSNAVKAVAKF